MAQACNGMRRKKGDNVDMKRSIMDIEANQAQNVNFHKDERTSTPKKSARYQREGTRLKFEELVRGLSAEEDLHRLTSQFAAILRIWQYYYANEDVLNQKIEILPGLRLSPLEVFALMPEENQELIMVNHPQRSPVKSGYNKSWLREEKMNVLVSLDQDR